MHRHRPLTVVLLAALLVALGVPARAATAPVETPGTVKMTVTGWTWPVADARIVAAFVAPAHRYGPGHRGIDLAAASGDAISSPSDGVIAFAGSVAGRGVVTIDHGDGFVTTLEPVHATLGIGTVVRAGDTVAFADAGGHAAVGTIHFGVREDGEYINPLLLFGQVPRAVLLPCC